MTVGQGNTGFKARLGLSYTIVTLKARARFSLKQEQ